MPNVNIGDNCIIGAGAVVTKNIPANSVAVGIPARVIEDIDTYYKNSKNSLENLNGMDYSEKKKYLKKRYIDMEKLWLMCLLDIICDSNKANFNTIERMSREKVYGINFLGVDTANSGYYHQFDYKRS